MRATYEIEPPEWAETLAILESTSLADGPEHVRARVVETDGTRVTLDFPALDERLGVAALVSSVVAGEWADRGDFERVRLVHVDWPDWLPGPRHPAEPRVYVGAIVKPALGLSHAEFAHTAAQLSRGGADLVKDDELLMGDVVGRVRAVMPHLRPGTLYTANVTGAHETLLDRAHAALDAGANALMLNVFAQGLDALRALREAVDVPLFAHRVGGAFLTRGGAVSVAPRVLAELTRLCGADFVQVGSFTERVADTPEEVHEQLAAARPSVAVIGGGIGPDNAREQLDRAGTREGVMLLLGSAAYADPRGLEAAVTRTISTVS